MSKITIKLPQLNWVIEGTRKDTILTMLNQEGVSIYAPCGGKGTCGKCKMIVKGNVSAITDEEKKMLGNEEIKQGIRLACKTYALDNVEVYLMEESLINASKEKLLGMGEYVLEPFIRKEIVQPEAPNVENGNTMVDSLRNVLGEVYIGWDMIRELSYNIDYKRKIVCTMYENQLIDVEYKNTGDEIYGVAIDIGTTTIACYLMDLRKGVQIGVSSMQNPQIGYGADVISRIHYTLEKDYGLWELREKLIKGIDQLIQKIQLQTKINHRHIYTCILVGNTTMAHIFWGLSCNSLSSMPFNAITKEMMIEDAKQVGLKNMNKNGKVIFLPGIAGFVGADTVGAMIAAQLTGITDNRLLLDLGTNGEIVLSTPKGRYACSTAAGPAFEGAKIKHGMQAFSGAINSVKISDDLYYTTIDNKPPKGICGSGLIDLVSELLRVGMITEDGRIKDFEEINDDRLSRRIVRDGRHKAIIIAYEKEADNHECILLTQKDIRELQLAKGAIRAGINILLKIAGLNFKDIDYVLLAGAFGNFVNKESARRIGIFPPIDLAKVIPMGNGAGEGAKMALCSRKILNIDAKYYSESTIHVEISSHRDFQQEFVESMYLK